MTNCEHYIEEDIQKAQHLGSSVAYLLQAPFKAPTSKFVYYINIEIITILFTAEV